MGNMQHAVCGGCGIPRIVVRRSLGSGQGYELRIRQHDARRPKDEGPEQGLCAGAGAVAPPAICLPLP